MVDQKRTVSQEDCILQQILTDYLHINCRMHSAVFFQYGDNQRSGNHTFSIQQLTEYYCQVVNNITVNIILLKVIKAKHPRCGVFFS